MTYLGEPPTKVKQWIIDHYNSTNITNITSTGHETEKNVVHVAAFIIIEGNGLKLNAGEFITYSGIYNGHTINGTFLVSALAINTDIKLMINYEGEYTGDCFYFDDNSEIIISIHGISTKAIYSKIP